MQGRMIRPVTEGWDFRNDKSSTDPIHSKVTNSVVKTIFEKLF